jgi:hypothetical protein
VAEAQPLARKGDGVMALDLLHDAFALPIE